jgi:E3 ubiquitin-protein ligase DOA10
MDEMSVIISINLNNYNTKINPLYCIPVDSEDSEEEEKQCRICLSDEGELISVCGCKGTVKYVHKDCIIKWQRLAPTAESKIKCQLCKQPYIYDGQIQREENIYNVNIVVVLLSLLFITLVVILIMIGYD